MTGPTPVSTARPSGASTAAMTTTTARACQGCGTPLPRHHPEDTCRTCQSQAAAAEARAADELARGRAAHWRMLGDLVIGQQLLGGWYQ